MSLVIGWTSIAEIIARWSIMQQRRRMTQLPEQ